MGLRLKPSWGSNYHKSAWEGWDRWRLYSPEIRQRLENKFSDLNLLHNHLPNVQSPLHSMLMLDQLTYLPDDLLLKTDYCTMAYGLEARAPFLDHRVAQAAARLPDTLLVSPDAGKIALRQIAAKYLPPELVQRPKRGFGVPLKNWFRDDLKDWLADLLIENATTSGQYFQPQVLKTIFEQHLSGRHNHTQKLLTLVVVELWHRHFFR
jgi:asparagine synthase (glutamine-hydrolysing)